MKNFVCGICFGLAVMFCAELFASAVIRPPRRDKEMAGVENFLVDAVINVGIKNNVWNKKEVIKEAERLKKASEDTLPSVGRGREIE